VRILRLDEIDSLGPFFTRFLNSKLWRGENYYLQIDAHTDFRSGWDSSLAAQMKATATYPFSVISNYPPGGTPTSQNAWPALRHPTTPDDAYAPSALCACSFETAGAGRITVRLGQSSRRIVGDLGTPRKSCFVAAGFFIAHGSIVDNVGFDPFLPYLFMGEELALSARFYTAGYDVYAPSVDVLQHEYVRKESPKFWETVGHVYSNGGLHNDLTDLVVQRGAASRRAHDASHSRPPPSAQCNSSTPSPRPTTPPSSTLPVCTSAWTSLAWAPSAPRPSSTSASAWTWCRRCSARPSGARRGSRASACTRKGWTLI
jgi:hypothetical protein